MDEYVTADEAGPILRCTPATVRQLIRDRKLPARKFGKRWLILKSDLFPCSTNVLLNPERTGGYVSASRVSRSGSRVVQIARNLRKRLNNS